MFITEFDAFVRKFHQLWNDGVTAHLDLDTHAGDAWVGLRVRLGQVPGPVYHHVHPFTQEVPRRESPSRQRRRARRAAARQASGVRATEAEEANEVELDPLNKQVVTDEVVEHTTEEPIDKAKYVDPVIDELCSNAEYNENFLSDENSVSYRFIVSDPALNSDVAAFKSKVKQSFVTSEVNFTNQLFEISGYEKVKDQSKFFLKIRNDEKAIEAIKNLKSDSILLMRIPMKKPKPKP